MRRSQTWSPSARCSFTRSSQQRDRSGTIEFLLHHWIAFSVVTGEAAMSWRRLAASLGPGLYVHERRLAATVAAHGITCSMTRHGNCHDNAGMESFFSTVKLNSASA
jgi:transposase InsO family protein